MYVCVYAVRGNGEKKKERRKIADVLLPPLLPFPPFPFSFFFLPSSSRLHHFSLAFFSCPVSLALWRSLRACISYGYLALSRLKKDEESSTK